MLIRELYTWGGAYMGKNGEMKYYTVSEDDDGGSARM